MAVYRLGTKVPSVSTSAYVAESAQVIGDVALGVQSSVWFGAVVRGDNGRIVVGRRSNVQDGAILHSSPGRRLVIGQGVTVGHQAMLHGCEIGDGSLIGIQAVVLDGAVVGDHCLIGAGAVVTAGMQVPARSLVLGAPARVVRPLRDEELTRLADNAGRYVRDAQEYQLALERIDVPPRPAEEPELPAPPPLRARPLKVIGRR